MVYLHFFNSGLSPLLLALYRVWIVIGCASNIGILLQYNKLDFPTNEVSRQNRCSLSLVPNLLFNLHTIYTYI